MPRQKLPSTLSRLGQSHSEDSEESRCLLGRENKMRRWRYGWRLSVDSQNNQIEKQQMRKRKHRIQNLYTKIFSISSILSRIVGKGPTILSLQESVLFNIYQHLPLVDKACLSLSCKRLFDLFGTILKRRNLNSRDFYIFGSLFYV